MSLSAQQKWMKLDNAATIYPAAMSRRWNALFRVSINLQEPIDPLILQKALDQTMTRFPLFAHGLGKGFFWHYLEPLTDKLLVESDVGNPCMRMNFKENKGFMLRVRYYDTRIAVEFFHVLTDGTGGMCFLKTLAAQYLQLKYAVDIPRDNKTILDCAASPQESESEDAFPKYARNLTRSRREAAAYRLPGSEEKNFMHIVTGLIDSDAALTLARKYKSSLTEFLTAVLILAIDDVQKAHNPVIRRHKPIKICVPINLRKYYPTSTLRNFSSFVNPGIEPKYGQYSLEETIQQVHAFMMKETDEKLLNARFTSNVQAANFPLLRVVPLFIKNPALKAAFLINGDLQSSSTLSNLGNIVLPDAMREYVERMDFMIGPLKRNPVAMACLSCNGQLVINLTRKISDSPVEKNFFRRLVKLGLHVKIESNTRW